MSKRSAAGSGLTSSPDRASTAELLALGLRQAQQSSIGAYIAAPIMALYLSDNLGSDLPLAWVVLIYLTLTARNHWLARSGRRLQQGEPDAAWNALLHSSALLALVMALLPAWALPQLSQGHALFFTTVWCLWVSAGMASLGVIPRIFLVYAGLVMLGLCVGWLRSRDDFSAPLALFILLYLGILAIFSRNFADIVVKGIRIRLANQKLVKQLELASEAKSRFILTASHDLRQPLHALTLFSSAISQSRTPEQMQAAALGIRQSVNGLVQLFSAVLDLSKMDARALTPRLRPVYLPELLGRLSQEYNLLCQEHGLRWQCQLLPVTVMTDPAMLEQLLRNLLDNALKHGGKGPVGIGMSQDQALAITVTDFGPGIPAAEREHIFEEFYRLPQSRHAHGLGLGLSIVQRLTRLLGYRLAVDYADPQQGLGSQFRLEIPLKQVLASGGPGGELNGSDEAPRELKGLRVLVIDDNAEVVQATALLLQQWGCEARGAGGLDKFLGRPAAAGFQPDVALIDNDRGTGSDALATASEVSARWPDAGILLVTGEADPEVLARLRQGGYPLLEKPVNPRELHEVLEMFHQLR